MEKNTSGLERYDRQMRIHGWSDKIQEQVAETRVTVVGAGGLGSPLLLYLTSAGIGNIHIIDGDTVSLTDLNRQLLYNPEDIGEAKAATAAERLARFNPRINITSTTGILSEENIEAIIPPTDILVDCLDNFAGRFLLNSYAVARKLPFIHAGIGGFNGELTTIIPGETPCLECLYSGMQDKRDEAGNKIKKPVVGAAAGVLGSLEAIEVMKLTTGLGEPHTNRLLVFEGLLGNFQEIEIQRNKNCTVCGAL